jgi:lysine 2,3-aminomutase
LGELEKMPEDLADPLGEEKDMPVTGITHRYPDRVLFYTTHHCPVYCRHCTRKRKVSDPSSAALKSQFSQSYQYLRDHKEIRDVVLSGGDPLSFSDGKLEEIISMLRSIPHIEIIRLGTRNPVTLPQRITPEFCAMIKKYHPIFVHTHFNHTKECSPDSAQALQLLADAGCNIGNQMVLMKDINEDPEMVLEMNRWLLKQRVRPYYMFQCDLAEGISHFRTPIEAGFKILRHLIGHTSGMAIPRYVVDLPGGGGKVPIQPDYLIKKEGRYLTFKNFRGEQYEYPEPP